MELEQLIITHKLNQTDLANEIKVSQGCFSEKLRKLRHSKFTPEQRKTLISYAKKYAKQLAEDVERLV